MNCTLFGRYENPSGGVDGVTSGARRAGIDPGRDGPPAAVRVARSKRENTRPQGIDEYFAEQIDGFSSALTLPNFLRPSDWNLPKNGARI